MIARVGPNNDPRQPIGSRHRSGECLGILPLLAPILAFFGGFPYRKARTAAAVVSGFSGSARFAFTHTTHAKQVPYTAACVRLVFFISDFVQGYPEILYYSLMYFWISLHRILGVLVFYTFIHILAYIQHQFQLLFYFSSLLLFFLLIYPILIIAYM